LYGQAVIVSLAIRCSKLDVHPIDVVAGRKPVPNNHHRRRRLGSTNLELDPDGAPDRSAFHSRVRFRGWTKISSASSYQESNAAQYEPDQTVIV